MADVQFYHQERVDGGRRSGVTVDGDAVLHGFVEGSEERNPALTWYADVTLSTPTPPRDATGLAWLLGHAAEIRAALDDAAEQLSTGIDVDVTPWEFETAGPEGPIRVSVSAMRRFTAVNHNPIQSTSVLSDRHVPSAFCNNILCVLNRLRTSDNLHPSGKHQRV